MTTKLRVPIARCDNGIHTIGYIRRYSHEVRYCVRCGRYLPGDI